MHTNNAYTDVWGLPTVPLLWEPIWNANSCPDRMHDCVTVLTLAQYTQPCAQLQNVYTNWMNFHEWWHLSDKSTTCVHEPHHMLTWVQLKYLGQVWRLWPKTQHIIVKQNEARIQIQKPKSTSQLVATPACNKCRTLICAWTTFWSIWIWWQLIVSYIFRYIATNTGGSKRRS